MKNYNLNKFNKNKKKLINKYYYLNKQKKLKK